MGSGGVPDGPLFLVEALPAGAGSRIEAGVGVTFGVVDEVVLAVEGTAFVVIEQHDVHASAGLFSMAGTFSIVP